MKQSKLFSLNSRDILKGIVIAILTPVLFLVQKSLELGTLTFNWRELGMAAVGGFIAYLIKNFLTPTPKQNESDQNNNNNISA